MLKSLHRSFECITLAKEIIKLKQLTMANLEIKKGTIIKAGNFLISIGFFRTSEIAILSAYSHEFIKQERTKTNKKLKKAKTRFKNFLCCDTSFCFRRFTDDMINELILILKG